MSVQAIFNAVKDIHAGTIVSMLVIISGLIEISPLKINPWAALGRLLTTDTNSKISEITKSFESMQKSQKEETEKLYSLIENIQGDLQTHVAESMRRDILDFQNACINRRKHTKEEFTYIYRLCDKYEQYIDDNCLSNSEAEEAIRYIRTVYRDCLESGAFIIKGEIEK